MKGVVVGPTTVSFVDGQNGRLIYRGYSIEDLARHATFEEVCHLLWHGRLPKRDELDALRRQMAGEASIPEWLVNLIRNLPPKTHPMDVLRTAVSALGGEQGDLDQSFETNLVRAVRLTAKTPTIIAAYARLRKGEDPVPPDPSLPLAARFLKCLHDKSPDDESARALDVLLILHADHGFNASTFAARVTVSTQADMTAGVTSAIATLKGPLHGGANQAVRMMLQKIKDPSLAEAWVKSELAQGRRIMGFGHRVYRVLDPRARILREYAKMLGERSGRPIYFEITRRLEEVMRQEKPRLNPNVDLYSGCCYECLGIETDLYTTMFAMGRMPGWTAHILEQMADNQLIRPLSDYQGERDRAWVPIEQR